MRLSSLTYLGFETNAVLDACPGFKLPIAEVHSASRAGRLVEHLATRFGAEADLSLLVAHPEELDAVNSALTQAADSLEGREARKTGVSKNGLCFVIALVLEAIQQ